MHSITITCHPDVLEVVAINDETKERTVAYVRKNSTTLVKEEGDIVLRAETFGRDSFQRFRELYLNKESKGRNEEIFIRLFEGIK